jgi:DNA uptake protein ComE-like DNA-binding protein
LQRFDKFLASATSEELNVAEELVAEHEEFAIYTNLSRKWELPPGRPNALSEVSDRPGDDFRRHGLAWMAALARLELGAIAAGFTDERHPLEFAKPGKYELPAYVELLTDALRTHYLALKADPVAQNFRRAQLTDPQALTYVRRVHITTELLRALRKGLDAAFSPEQRKLLKDWEIDLNGMQQTLLFQVLKIQPEMFHFTNVQKDVKTKQVEMVDINQAELADLSRRLNMQHCPACLANILNDMARDGRLRVLPN